MYGLLQLLPQSDAFRTLHARLHAAPTAALLQLSPPPSSTGNGAPGKSPAEVQARHQESSCLFMLHCTTQGEAAVIQCSLLLVGEATSLFAQAAAAKQIGFDRLLALFVQRQVNLQIIWFWHIQHPALCTCAAAVTWTMVETTLMGVCRRSMPERKSSVGRTQTQGQVT